MDDRRWHDSEAQALARLAALQRLLEHAVFGNREETIRSVKNLIDQEAQALRAPKHREGHAE